MGELVLVGEAGRRDRLKPGEKRFVRLVPLRDGIERVLAKFVVVAVVPKRGSTLGKIAEVGLVLLVEKSVLCRETTGKRSNLLGKNGAGDSDDTKKSLVKANSLCRLSKEAAEENRRGTYLPR
jgi:hypothetical protein